MPTINIEKDHQHSRTTILPIVEDIRTKLNQRYQVNSVWNGDNKILLTKQNITGEILLSPAHIAITIKLPYMYSFFKAKLEQQVIAVLEEKLT